VVRRWRIGEAAQLRRIREAVQLRHIGEAAQLRRIVEATQLRLIGQAVQLWLVGKAVGGAAHGNVVLQGWSAYWAAIAISRLPTTTTLPAAIV